MKPLIKKLLKEGLTKILKNDTFIHFTSGSNVSYIMGSKSLGKEGSSTFAVSVTWGIYNDGAVLPKNAGAAVLFKTDKLPKYGYVEEVVWNGVVPLTSAKVIPVETAVAMLRRSEAKTPVGEMDIVNYIQK